MIKHCLVFVFLGSESRTDTENYTQKSFYFLEIMITLSISLLLGCLNEQHAITFQLEIGIHLMILLLLLLFFNLVLLGGWNSPFKDSL